MPKGKELPYSTLIWSCNTLGFPGGSDGKESACIAGDLDSIPGSGRSPGEGNGDPLQYSCLENPMDGGAWCPWGRKESDRLKVIRRFDLLIKGSIQK